MAICPDAPHADLATRPATPQPARRQRMLPPISAGSRGPQGQADAGRAGFHLTPGNARE